MTTRATTAEGSQTGQSWDILALGFGTAVAMWAVGYVCRFPVIHTPGWLLLVLLVLCLFAGGFIAGRYADRGWRGGLYAGVLAALLNLLVLGSLLSGSEPEKLAPSALYWLPGSLLLSGIIAITGAWVGNRAARQETRDFLRHNGTTVFATITACATFLLLVAGGIVTSNEAGLAVVDWPNSYGYNMFLYPLSRMTGGIYYEHVHRLLGSLVGLSTLVLALYTQRSEPRRSVRIFALAALGTVILQGLLGGLRVTGHFTLSSDPQVTAPNLTLAIVHGVLGQVFFGMILGLAVVTSRLWQQTSQPILRPAAATDRSLAKILVLLLLVQLVLGAILRHLAGGLLIHISMAVIVILLAVAMGVRLWAQYEDIPTLRRLGNLLLILISVQLALGLGALVATGLDRSGEIPHPADIVLTTAHQACGAALLACTTVLTLWLHRLVAPEA